MRVAFVHVGWKTHIPEVMVASVKRHGVKVTQLTDTMTDRVTGVDEVIRLDWDRTNFMVYKLQHLANLPKDDWLILDTDIIVNELPNPQKDIVLTKRSHSIIDPNGRDVGKEMPYNAGVVFCRVPEFWQDCLEQVKAMSQLHRDWYGDQIALKDAATRFDVQELPCDPWNYSPESCFEDVSDKKIVHYKGPRKEWMIESWHTKRKTQPLTTAM